MFGGEAAELQDVLRQVLASARDLGHQRAGSEHLLWRWPGRKEPAQVLARHGATAAAIRDAVVTAAPAGAGAAADRDLLAALGPGLDGLAGTASLDGAASPDPVFPLGASRARRRCARMRPPLGLDAQAIWAASLRLALARRERRHRPEHLALALVTLDPGAAWILRHAGADRSALAADLAAAFPATGAPPAAAGRARLGRRVRARTLVQRSAPDRPDGDRQPGDHRAHRRLARPQRVAWRRPRMANAAASMASATPPTSAGPGPAGRPWTSTVPM